MPGLNELLSRKGRGPSAISTSRASGGQTSHCSLTRQIAFHLGKSRHHVEEEPPGGRGCVDTVGQASKFDAVLIQPGHKLDELTHRAPKAVELPYNQRIAGSKVRQGVGQSRTVEPTPAELVGENPNASGDLERVSLERQILLISRDSRIA